MHQALEAPNDMMKIVLMILVAGALSACGSTEVVAPPTVNVSIGQQLIDLKNARDSNAISQKEWEQQKERLIKSVK